MLVSLSHFFGQHGYIPVLQNLDANVNMRATLIAFGNSIKPGEDVGFARSIDLAPTIAYLLRIPERPQSQGRVLLELLKDSSEVTPLTVIALNDFRGQLSPTTMQVDGQNIQVGGAARAGPRFSRKRPPHCPGRPCCCPPAIMSAASPPNSGSPARYAIHRRLECDGGGCKRLWQSRV